MNLELKRIALKPTYTIGKLYIDGKYFCDTLEDTVRPAGVKIKGQTAIAAGTYKVEMTMSNRFKRVLPLLIGVPNFEGIRIHRGNTDIDTEGCILVGENKVVGKVINATATEQELVLLLKNEKNITIKIS